MMARPATIAAVLMACFGMLAASAVAQSQDMADVPMDPAAGNKFPMPDATQDEQAAQAPMPTGVTGRVAIRAVQGTPGAPPIGSVPVTLQLVHSGAVIRTIESQLDEHGVVVLEDVPIGMGVLPVVRVDYADVTYQQPGERMDVTNRQQTIEVTCYEVTEEKPDWRMVMRHVMVGRAEGGLMVAEIVVINNPGQRTWLGEKDPSGQVATCVLPVPTAATNVTLGKGFYNWSTTTYEPGRLVSKLPLMPGSTELQFRYNIPAEDGSAAIDIASDNNIDQMMIVVPAELESETVEGIKLGGTDSFGQQEVRYYRTSNVQPGDSVHLVLSGLGAASGAAAASTAASGTMNTMRIVVAVAAAVLVILAIVVLLKRRPADHTATSTPG